MSANGQLTPAELTPVQGSIELADDAAADYLAMKYYGMPGSIALPAGGYRSIATQEAMHANPAAYNIAKGVAIAPVGASTHGLGENADLVGGARQWAIINGAKYGFTQRDAKGDPNCFHHAPGVHVGLPKPVEAADVRTTVAKGANLRSSADSSSPTNIVSTLKGNVAYPIDYFVVGDAPTGTTNSVWFFVAGALAWSGAFTDPSVTGIPSDPNPVIPATPVATTPAPEPAPVTTPVTVPPVTTVPEPVDTSTTTPSDPSSGAPTPDPVVTAPTPPVETPPVVVSPPPVSTPVTTVPPTKVTKPKSSPAGAILAVIGTVITALVTWWVAR